MENIWIKTKLIFNDSSLRKKIFFLLGFLVISRVLAAVPIPGIDAISLEQFFSDNQFFGLINLFSGGGLSGLSIVMLGVGPYITASIIMQLLTMIVPKMEAIQKEGESGQQRINQWTRMLTVPLAIIQAYGFLLWL